MGVSPLVPLRTKVQLSFFYFLAHDRLTMTRHSEATYLTISVYGSAYAYVESLGFHTTFFTFVQRTNESTTRASALHRRRYLF
jgi:hypothetical protein